MTLCQRVSDENDPCKDIVYHDENYIITVSEYVLAKQELFIVVQASIGYNC